MVEVHDDPKKALCDGAQALSPDDFKALMSDLGKITAALGHALAAPARKRK
jgi:3-deoxy-7-phosphoheptulonate synthase